MSESKINPAEKIAFEPHNGFGGKDFYGEPWPFGYISHEIPRMPIFELDVVVGDDFKAMRATAEKMVRAYNAHDDMLEALKGVVAVADRDTPEFARARAAISKAEGARDEALKEVGRG